MLAKVYFGKKRKIIKGENYFKKFKVKQSEYWVFKSSRKFRPKV